MSKCRYDLLEDCRNKDCLACVLDEIRAEIEVDALEDVNGSKYIFVNRIIQIIDKYKSELNPQESEKV